MGDVSGAEQSWRLRHGNEIAFRDDVLFIDKGGDEETFRVELDDVVEVTRRTVDWFTGVMSVLLVGIGLLLTTDSVLGGLGFAAAGAVSVYLTYRRRDEMNLRVRGRTKPLKVYPVNGDRFYADLERMLEVEAARDDGEADEDPA